MWWGVLEAFSLGVEVHIWDGVLEELCWIGDERHCLLGQQNAMELEYHSAILNMVNTRQLPSLGGFEQVQKRPGGVPFGVLLPHDCTVFVLLSVHKT